VVSGFELSEDVVSGFELSEDVWGGGGVLKFDSTKKLTPYWA
jgi:hypothetical protein